MGKFKEKLYRFAYGRYGTDQLYYFSLVLALIVSVADFITQWLMPESIVKTVLGLSASAVILFLFVWMWSSRHSVHRRRGFRWFGKVLPETAELRRKL